MHGFSTVDGFLSVKEGVDEMIKYLANEPSVGLFFVQQHAQTSMPYLLNVKDKVVEEIHEVTLQTEDIEDSIYVVRSMTEYGLPIADEMIKDINKSLHIMSTSQPKRGLIQNPIWGFQAGRASSSTRYPFNSNISSGRQSGGSSRNYLSAVFSSAKQKAVGFRWGQPGTVPKGPQSEQPVSSSIPPLSAVNIGALSSLPDVEGEELPLSSHLSDDLLDEADAVGESLYSHDMSSMKEIYDKFKSEREVKLEEWLQEPEDCHRFSGSGCG
ncbi:uncharacterized protein LOC103721802 [Phoenix dactylifera]|uniref:Uncharacterized protein LOC103721802 n=1 Tax=Phoenix dactylifera TaxID=42345 RepID=A0A8B7D0D9_PHODC|nr:uncharacterized protein LOC103721802 [Phoenix dactylifera]